MVSLTSCLTLETMAKYCGKSVVRTLVMREVLRSSSWASSSPSKPS